MAKVTLENVTDLLDLVGKEIEVSDWVDITQDDVNL